MGVTVIQVFHFLFIVWPQMFSNHAIATKFSASGVEISIGPIYVYFV